MLKLVKVKKETKHLIFHCQDGIPQNYPLRNLLHIIEIYFHVRCTYELRFLLVSLFNTHTYTPYSLYSISVLSLLLFLCYYTQAPHEVLLEVEETKSEGGGSPDITLDFSVPPRVTFDRPFMLIIYDNLTGLVLLIGRILDPTDV